MSHKHGSQCNHDNDCHDNIDKKNEQDKKNNYLEIQRYKKAVICTCLVFLIQFFVALISGSLTLLSDTFHVGSDLLTTVGSLVVAYLALSLTKKKEENVRVIFAYAGILLLGCSAVYVLVEVWDRFLHPVNIMTWPVIITAIAGASGNYYVYRLLHAVPKEECNHTHNVLSAHVLSDFLLSIVVVISAILVLIFAWNGADLLISFFVALYMLYLSFNLFMSVRKGKYHFH